MIPARATTCMRWSATCVIFRAQLERAELVAGGSQHDVVHFGARVTVVDDGGDEQAVHIVGDDEADAAGRRNQLGIAAGARAGSARGWAMS